MNLLKGKRKWAALAAFLCIGATGTYFGAHEYAEHKFVQKLASKGIKAEVGSTSLSIEGVTFNNVDLNIKSSKTYVGSISSNWELTNIDVQGAIVQGKVEDYLSLREFEKPELRREGVLKKSSRSINIDDSKAGLTFRGIKVDASKVSFSTDTNAVSAGVVKLGSYIHMEEASMYLDTHHADIETLRVTPKLEMSKSGDISLKTPETSELKVPALPDAEYSLHISNVLGTLSGKNVNAKYKKDSKSKKVHASIDVEYPTYGRSEDGMVDPSKGLFEASSAKLEFEGMVEGDFKSKLIVDDISVWHTSIAKEQFDLSEVTVNLGVRNNHLVKYIDVIGSVNGIAGEAYLTLNGNKPSDIVVGTELVECAKVVKSLPEQWKLNLGKSQYDGRMQLSIKGESLEELEVKLFADCKIMNPLGDINPERFKRGFKLMVGPSRSTELVTGPNTPKWVPLHMMTHYIEPVLLTTEDGRFFTHKGYDSQAISRLIKESVKAGEVPRGASTITQQLAKNLWLSRSRTVARKLEEFFLALHLENSFTKEEILELYLNVVEFGPGVYGVYDGSMHYFDKPPMDLTLRETLFLGSILPKPTGTYFVDGRLNNGTAAKLDYLLKIMNTRRKIGKEELLESLSEVLRSK